MQTAWLPKTFTTPPGSFVLKWKAYAQRVGSASPGPKAAAAARERLESPGPELRPAPDPA